MSSVDFFSRRGGQALHGVVACTQQHCAHQIDSNMKPQVCMFDNSAISSIYCPNLSTAFRGDCCPYCEDEIYQEHQSCTDSSSQTTTAPPPKPLAFVWMISICKVVWDMGAISARSLEISEESSKFVRHRWRKASESRTTIRYW